jgi:hypothetical protein
MTVNMTSSALQVPMAFLAVHKTPEDRFLLFCYEKSCLGMLHVCGWTLSRQKDGHQLRV